MYPFRRGGCFADEHEGFREVLGNMLLRNLLKVNVQRLHATIEAASIMRGIE